MEAKKLANATTRTPSAVAGELATSGNAVAASKSEHTMLVRIMISGARHVATSGVTTKLSGTSMKTAGAGWKRLPSHHTGRPMVRLLMATATRAARTAIQEMKDTVRHPDDGIAGSDFCTVGGVSSTFFTVHIFVRRQAIIGTNLWH
jgi:hypothetical protein